MAGINLHAPEVKIFLSTNTSFSQIYFSLFSIALSFYQKEKKKVQASAESHSKLIDDFEKFMHFRCSLFKLRKIKT
jgi:hypothetical protein